MEEMSVFVELLAALGVSPKWVKCELPCKVSVFLGICIDITNMVLSLPDSKVSKCVNLITQFVENERVSLTLDEYTGKNRRFIADIILLVSQADHNAFILRTSDN